MAQARKESLIGKNNVNDYVRDLVKNPIIKIVSTNYDKRLLRNPIKIENAADSSSRTKQTNSEIQQTSNSDNVNSGVHSEPVTKLKNASEMQVINENEIEDDGPGTKRKTRTRIRHQTSSYVDAEPGTSNKKRSRIRITNVSESKNDSPDGPDGSTESKKRKRSQDHDIGDDEANQPQPNTQKNKKRSKVWPHFNICFLTVNGIVGRYAQCKYCVKKYKASHKNNGSTGNLIRHLEKHHPEKWENEVEDPFVFSQDNFREALLKWMVISSQPFSVVEEDAFIDLIKTLNPTATVVSNETYKAHLMEAYHDKIEQIKEDLKDVPGKISITLDIWTILGLKFLVIRAHWITTEWEYKTELLDFAYSEGDHSGQNQCHIFLECIRRFDIPLYKILAFTMDNATSNGTFISFLHSNGVQMGIDISNVDYQVICLAHILNSAVQDMLKSFNAPYMEDEIVQEDEEDIEEDDDESEDSEGEEEDEDENDEEDEDDELLQNVEGMSPTAKLRILVRKVRKSTKLRQKLKRLCRFYKLKRLVPYIDVSTLWNSSYKMIVRAEYLRVPLSALCLKRKGLSSLALTEAEWQHLKDIKELLSKFDRATQLISMERHETFCYYLPTMNWLLGVLTDYASKENGPLAAAAHAGLTKLLEYELKVENHRLQFIATVLNPALKMNYFKEHNYNQMTLNRIERSISDYYTENYGTNSDTEDIQEQIDDELFSHIYRRSTAAYAEASQEFERYLSYPLSPAIVTDVLGFWKAQTTKFPRISKMARDFLAIQTTSVPVESDNSAGADLVTPNRCSDTIQASMCLKRWFANEV